MGTFDHAELAIRVVEATIRELPGHFRKGKALKRFYRDIRAGRTKCFVALRDDPEDFVGLLFDRSATPVRFNLWVHLNTRDDGPPWCRALQELRLGSAAYTYRSPQDPIRLARTMGFAVTELEDDANADADV